jgi:hypothetical protein
LTKRNEKKALWFDNQIPKFKTLAPMRC